jgi:DNA-binding HxlR family transcriptional regulator
MPRRARITHADSSATLERRSACPVACSLDVVGDRWTLLVIRDLFAGKHRFGEFLASTEGIPTNILAERLKRLEAAGLVAALPYSERPLRHEYHLTDRGQALAPVLDAIAVWGLAQFPGTRRGLRRRSEPHTAEIAKEARPTQTS